jgi:hypothetical protein
MPDLTKNESDMTEQKPDFRLNPEVLEKVLPEERAEIELIECWVRELPWYKRMGEGIMHHLAGELAGIAIGTCIALSRFGHAEGPKSFDLRMLDKVCVAAVVVARAGEQMTFRLVPCPPTDDTTLTPPTGDGSGKREPPELPQGTIEISPQ